MILWESDMLWRGEKKKRKNKKIEEGVVWLEGRGAAPAWPCCPGEAELPVSFRLMSSSPTVSLILGWSQLL